MSQTDADNKYNTFSYNYFKDIIKKSDNGQEAIQIGQGNDSGFISAYTTVEYNLFDNTSGDAEIISSKSSLNIFQYNTFRNCKGNLVLRFGNSSLVEGNFFFNSGLRIHGKNHEIINNYFEGGDIAIDIWTGIAVGMMPGRYQGVSNCLIAHNTILNTKKAAIYLGRNAERRDGIIEWNVAP